MRKNKTLLGLLISTILLLYSTFAAAFVVERIQVTGNQRIRSETVMNYISVKPGNNIETADTQHILDDLYRTGFFDDIHLTRRGNILVVHVTERQVIGNLTVSGNKLIKDKDLNKSLKDNGISAGMVFDRFKIMAIKNALEEQYHRLGRYNAVVKVDTQLQSRNRVAINIQIYEGDITHIKKIRIVGSHCFSESKLLHRFKLSRRRLWTRLTHSDEYSREKFDQDLQGLRDFYLDRGYLYFKVTSTQVEITPDKKSVYITVYIHEGDVYNLEGYRVTGDLLHREAAIIPLIHLKKGEPFSRKDLMTAHKALTNYFANCGYANAVIQIKPDIDSDHRCVTIVFDVNPGKPVYIHRVTFQGNSRTRDQVLRRAMLQFEAAIYSKLKLEESKRRLMNLGYLEHVDYQIHPVPGHRDQVDVVYQVSEASSATASAQVGYSDSVGLLYGASLKQPNFLGTGNNLSVNFDKNDAYRNIGINYFNPYYTISGIGRGLNFYYKKTTPSHVGISPYSTDSFGLDLNYSIPISIHDHLTLGLGYKHMKIYTSSRTSTEILNFVKEEGDEFDQVTINGGLIHSTFDRAIFPTRGFMSNLAFQVGVPLFTNSLAYYKVTHLTSYYYPFTPCWVFHTRTRLGYGDGYGRTNDLPFFLNYYGGGIDTIRGIRDNSLGPRDSRGKPLGGNIIVVGGVSLIFPNFVSDQVRTSLFIDSGNVYQNRLDFTDIHFTAGLQIEWLSPFGPLQFSLAQPLNHVSGQQSKLFQFTIGTSL